MKIINNIIKKLIIKTNRESLTYKLLDKISFLILKYFYKIKYHFHKKKILKKFSKKKIKKIQFGTSGNKLKGYLNTDLFGKIPIDITDKLPFKDDSIDVIYSSHLVEHIYIYQFIKFLKESRRILKNGCIQIIQTPSLEKICKIVYSSGPNKELILSRHTKKHSRLKTSTPAEYLNDVIHLNFGHKFLLDFDIIKILALREGYSTVEKINIKNLKETEIKKIANQNKYRKLITETYILTK